MTQFIVQPHSGMPIARQDIEYVERKGLGHPDTICDSIMESISVRLSQEYLQRTGRVLHHNIDKGLLVAGQTTPQLGGGTVEAPMRLVVGDRATIRIGDQQLAMDELIETAARDWMSKHLRFVDPKKHLVIQNELHPGSAELVGLFDSGGESDIYRANDTSVAVGFAPLSETEHLVLAAEHFLNSPGFKREFPETGEDVKVMGVRHRRDLQLTVAMAFVDRQIWEPDTYFHRKRAVQRALSDHLQTKQHELDCVSVQLNTLDDPTRGLDGMYLTVLGTSAESADGGQVGRGNRGNGLISFCRPMTTEAVAGKNPVSHVGKVYNLLAYQLAHSIYRSVPGLDEVYVWLCSQIGGRLDEPWFVSTQVALAKDATLADVRDPIETLVRQELHDIHAFSMRLARGELTVC